MVCLRMVVNLGVLLIMLLLCGAATSTPARKLLQANPGGLPIAGEGAAGGIISGLPLVGPLLSSMLGSGESGATGGGLFDGGSLAGTRGGGLSGGLHGDGNIGNLIGANGLPIVGDSTALDLRTIGGIGRLPMVGPLLSGILGGGTGGGLSGGANSGGLTGGATGGNNGDLRTRTNGGGL